MKTKNLSFLGYSNYHVDTDGKVYNEKRKCYMSTHTNNAGYVLVSLTNDSGTKCNELVHRLVAQAFLPNPDNCPDVEHKNTDKTNNKKSNLKWITHSDNIKNMHKNKKKCKEKAGVDFGQESVTC